MATVPETKICSKCKIEKPRGEFSLQTSKASGLRSQCKVCASATKRPSGWQGFKKRRDEGRASPIETEKRKQRERARSSKREQYSYKHRTAERRLFLDAYKIDRGCADCGYNAHPAALDFDHLPGYDKTIAIASSGLKPLDAVISELKKCEVVCANCHRIRTVQRRKEKKALANA